MGCGGVFERNRGFDGSVIMVMVYITERREGERREWEKMVREGW